VGGAGLGWQKKKLKLKSVLALRGGSATPNGQNRFWFYFIYFSVRGGQITPWPKHCPYQECVLHEILFTF
jgi:hypothetical protein